MYHHDYSMPDLFTSYLGLSVHVVSFISGEKKELYGLDPQCVINGLKCGICAKMIK